MQQMQRTATGASTSTSISAAPRSLRSSSRAGVVVAIAAPEKAADTIGDKSGLKYLGEVGRANALAATKNKFEKVKVEKCGSTAWTEVSRRARRCGGPKF